MSTADITEEDIDREVDEIERTSTDARTRQRGYEAGVLLGICLFIGGSCYQLYNILLSPALDKMILFLVCLLILGFLIGNLSCCSSCRIMTDAKSVCTTILRDCKKNNLVNETQYQAYKAFDISYS